MAIVVTHRSLNHFHSSLSHLGDGSWDIHYLLFSKRLLVAINAILESFICGDTQISTIDLRLAVTKT